MQLGNPVEILVVEDNDSQRECIVAAIEAAAHDTCVATASGTEDAMAVLLAVSETEPPKLIVLDLNLGDGNGLEVLTRIRAGEERSPVTHVPIVIFSDSQDEKNIAEGYRLGANSYIVKPFDYLEFQGVVEALVRYWLSRNMTANAFRNPD